MKTAFIAGIWDLMHTGHLNILRNIRKRCDKLVVIIHDDKSCFEIKDKIPIQNLKQRIENLKITGLADEIIVCRSSSPDKEFEKVIRKYPNCVYMRGDDLTKNFPAKKTLIKHKVPILFLKYTKGISSTWIKSNLEKL